MDTSAPNDLIDGSSSSETRRMAERDHGVAPWSLWGSYLSERQWGTVREDYSADGDAWTSFPHDHARSRAYRWGEDGLLGICDNQGRLCFGLALWNGVDPILKDAAAAAALVSMDRIRACACTLRTILACSIRGRITLCV
jgi:hypothetical protein